MIRYTSYLLFVVFIGVTICSCGDDDPLPNDRVNLETIPFSPREYLLSIPDGFPAMDIPADNPLTVQGVALGRHLFYDPILSIDSTQSCATCHELQSNFTDNLAVSPGVEGLSGTRSSMTLLNVGFSNTGLFWDGRVNTLEEQALIPIEDPLELNDSWTNVENKLQRSKSYPQMFREAFGIEERSEITKELAVKAIAQFERSLISSGNSKYDKVIAGLDVFTDQELDGFEIFFDINPDQSLHAECGHCHNAPLFTTNEYFNNGIDAVDELGDFSDLGRGAITNIPFDNGTFRVPTLRNIDLTAPFMHDGRFQSLDQVIDHYASGGNKADNLGAVIRPLSLDEENREALKAFILTLQDPDFVSNPAFASPF